MRHLIIVGMLALTLSGCSLLPRVTFDTLNTVPQSVVKGKAKDICKGEAKFNEVGEMVYCSSGYYAYSENYNKAERKMTIIEMVRSWINNILGWGIPGLLIICFFIPGGFTIVGTIIGRLFEGAYGAASQTLRRVARAVQNSRKRGADLDTSLETELDDVHKKYIRKIKDKEKIK